MSRAASVRASMGFTLIELLVVIVILAGASALLVVRFDGALAGMELRAAARDVASALRYARGRAIATQSETAVLIDVDERRYRLMGTQDVRERHFSRQITVDIVTDRGSFVSDSEAAIRFFPDGSSTGGRVSLSTERADFSIDVHWLTGRVRIADGPES